MFVHGRIINDTQKNDKPTAFYTFQTMKQYIYDEINRTKKVNAHWKGI